VPKRAYVGAVVGFLVGSVVALYFSGDAPETAILRGLQLASAFAGAIGGLAAGVANKAGNGRDKIVLALTIAAWMLIGLVIFVYRML